MSLKSNEYVRILALRTVGNFLILTSLFMITKTFSKPLYEEIRYLISQREGKTYVVSGSSTVPRINNKGALASFLKNNKIEVLTPVDPNFGIVIPKIAANSPVIANVDPTDEKEYLKTLLKGVAHTKGTAFPGEGGHIFLFAHSTDYFWNVGTYNAVFYLLYKLDKGDEINLFYKGKRNVYKVIDKKIIDPSEVQYLTRKSDAEFLTLQTCWPLGTTLKRLLVFAVRSAK